MQILNRLEQLNKSVLAIGTFDGLHLGHQDIIRTARHLATELSLPLSVLTFRKHPLTLLRPQSAPLSLVDREQKCRLLADLGTDLLLDVDFTAEFAEISAEDFISKIREQQIVVGADFHFGKKALGNAGMLPKAVIRPLLHIDGEIVSSTSIRRAISTGDIIVANKLLGRPFAVRGQVEHGQQRGRTLGFPTANLSFGNYVVPAFGAYVVNVKFSHDAGEGQTQAECYGIANVGNNPTFGGVQPRLEVHLFGFEGNLYGKTLEVGFLHRLRGEKKFKDTQELVEQLKKDQINACTYLQSVISLRS